MHITVVPEIPRIERRVSCCEQAPERHPNFQKCRSCEVVRCMPDCVQA